MDQEVQKHQGQVCSTIGAQGITEASVGVNVIGINHRQVFVLEEAQALLPVIFRITKAYSQKVEALVGRLEALSANETLADALERQVNDLILEWQSKVQKLGAVPKGLWIADFDSGDGYFCWKFPERGIKFWHRYNDGFSKRILVSERTKPVSLQDRLRKRILSFAPEPL